MPDWLTSLLAIPAVGAAIAGFVVVFSKALERRSRSWAATLNAKAALLDAEAQKLLAEARAREAQARITESDAYVIRMTVETLTERVTVLEGTVAMKDADLRVAREQRDEAHERIDVMRSDFHAFNRAVRAGRPPKHTPPSLARVEQTQPYGAK